VATRGKAVRKISIGWRVEVRDGMPKQKFTPPRKVERETMIRLGQKAMQKLPILISTRRLFHGGDQEIERED
jgi:hypothetical protein